MSSIALHGVDAGGGGEAPVEGVSLAVGAGEIVALLGANGAGKTTVVEAACGLVEPSRGRVELFGRDVTTATVRARARLGLGAVLEDRGIFTQLTVAENIRVATPPGARATQLEGLFPELFSLLDRRAGLLSGGEQTLLALARALARRPGALVVDELSTGLAPAWAHLALVVLRRAATEWGTGVLLVEQSAHLALRTADRACVLRRGRVELEGTPAEIAARGELLEAAYLGEMG